MRRHTETETEQTYITPALQPKGNKQTSGQNSFLSTQPTISHTTPHHPSHALPCLLYSISLSLITATAHSAVLSVFCFRPLSSPFFLSSSSFSSFPSVPFLSPLSLPFTLFSSSFLLFFLPLLLLCLFFFLPLALFFISNCFFFVHFSLFPICLLH
ncbi:MAG: hypothetical protein JOS17DRAFT_231605 [Linnemannia elongata]|nr:MAG: hypothetical protein JOS17DRAFT_231605 [Linnemannia elongata]